jgi:hypothetical protein
MALLLYTRTDVVLSQSTTVNRVGRAVDMLCAVGCASRVERVKSRCCWFAPNNPERQDETI